VVTANEDVGREIYYLGDYEPNETNFLGRVLRESDVCLDVGANIGYYTTLMARIAAKGIIHAFEPDPLSYALLNVNVCINRLRNVVFNQVAVGKESCKSPFVVASDHAFSSLANTGRKAVEQVINVSVTTLDEYVCATGIQRVDFLKVDVEGAEGAVMDGAQQILSDPARRPRLIMLELFEPNHALFGYSIDRIVNSLRVQNYEPFIVLNEQQLRFGKQHYNNYYNVFFSQDVHAL